MNRLLDCLRARSAGVAAGVLLVFALTGAAAERSPAAVSLSAKGMILRREEPKAPWQLVADKEELQTGDLILGLPGAAIQSRDGAVQLRMLADFHSPLPVLEPAIVLHEARDVDLDFTLERGRVDVTAQKEKDPTRVRVQVWGHTWEATLHGNGARLAMELLGRWPAGSRFHHASGSPSEPVARLIFLVVHGDVDLKHDGITQALSAPPGPALLGWNSITGADATPMRLDKLPAWAQPAEDPASQEELQKRIALRDRLATALAEHPLGEVIDHLAASEDPQQRRIGVILAAAVDDLPHLGHILTHGKHADTWDFAVVALRHWLGRGPGQDRKLYEGLTSTRGFTPVQAEALIDMLHGFSPEDRSRPELYQLLINYLASDKLGLRGLAHWHLVRLVPVPEGESIPFNPQATPQERKEEQAKWRKLVPPGELPRQSVPGLQPGASK